MQYLKQSFLNQIRNCRMESLHGEVGRFYNDMWHINPRNMLHTVTQWMRVPVVEIIREYLTNHYGQHVADNINNMDLNNIDEIARNLRAVVVLMEFIMRHEREYISASSDEDFGEHDALAHVDLARNGWRMFM
jgi:hypothetical protein